MYIPTKVRHLLYCKAILVYGRKIKQRKVRLIKNVAEKRKEKENILKNLKAKRKIVHFKAKTS